MNDAVGHIDEAFETFREDSILPPATGGLEPLHDREYRIRAFRAPDGQLLVVAALRDQHPGALYFDGGAPPVVLHHMIVELTIALPTLELSAVEVTFEANPHQHCPLAADAYAALVGLPFGRGFHEQLRQRLSPTAACVHVTALLNAVRPTVMQQAWVMDVAVERAAGASPEELAMPRLSAEAIAVTLDTCHVWAADGAVAARVRAGSRAPMPVPLRRAIAAQNGTDVTRSPDRNVGS